ncbi:tail collar protein [Thioclava dalianensis]|uniref:Tail collar protein n=1 Tax=Thioclava dalianensis TaxID=1185766 RepID=A0A074TE61_9RHOB|nr:tail fiber protein [Thioclava dalianensis]KEP69984.1 tail collar protein [Thioclava dalianensis]SFN18696.1 Microcystin-dependent protein [Thioclava dalianensis]
MEPILCMVMPFPYDFIPRGWMPCNGQVLPVSQYTAVFSLIGTTYGGNGTTNFALPNLNGQSGRSPAVVAGLGVGPGLSPRQLGETLGTDTVTLSTQEMPAHNHSLILYGKDGDQGVQVPVQGLTWISTGANGYVTPPGTTPTSFAPEAIAPSGGNQPHDNAQPNLEMVYCIAVEGIYPSFS